MNGRSIANGEPVAGKAATSEAGDGSTTNCGLLASGEPETSSKEAASGGMKSGRTRLCLVVLVLAGFALGCSEFVVVGIQPELAVNYGISLSRAGAFMSTFAVAYAACTPILALVTGRFKRYTLLIAYSVVFIAGNYLAMVASSFAVMIVARILIGVVSGALLAVEVTFIPEFTDARRVPGVISIVYAAFSFAMVLSTSLGKLAAELLTWHVALVVAFAMSVAISVVLALAMPKTGKTDAPATATDQLPYLRDSRILLGMAIFVFGVGSVYTFYGYVTPYLQEVLGVSPVSTSVVLMAYGVACMASNLLSGWCAGRFGMKSLIVSFSIQAVLLAMLFALGGAQVPGVAVVLLVGLSMYIVSTPCITMFMDVAQNEYPKALTLAASTEPMSFNVGIAFGTAVGGGIIGGLGISFVGLFGSAFSLIACGIVVLTIRLAKRKRAVR